MAKPLLQCGGGSRGNPGPAACGYVVYDISNGNDAGIVLEKSGNYIGVTTNNQAEYQGLIAGLTWVATNHPTAELSIKMDSLLIVNQVKGLYKVKSPDLIPRIQEVRGVLNKIQSWSIAHTYREGNSLADSLVNEALDNHQ